MRAMVLAAMSLALAGCVKIEEERSPAADAEAVAKAERLSKPPLVPIRPEQITYQDIEQKNLFGAGCAAKLTGNKDAVFLGGEKKGWLKLDGEIAELSADKSSDELPFAARTKYIGLENWVTIERDGSAETQTGDEVFSAPGEIVVYDFADRVVFRRKAAIECGA